MSAPVKPFRVLVLTETCYPEVGGGERQADVLSRGLLRRGHEVLLLTRRTRPDLPTTEMGTVPIFRVGPIGPGRLRKWGLLLTVLPALWRLRDRFDIVLVSGFRILAMPALLAGRALGKPVVLKADSNGEMSGEFFRAGLSGAGLRPESWLVRRAIALRNRLLRHAAAFVAISEEIYGEFIAAGSPPERVHRIANGVDTVEFAPPTASERAALKRRLGLPAGPIVIYTGRLVSYKGVPLLLEAWRGLVAQGVLGTLVFVGEGGGDMHNCEPALREYTRSHGLGDRVTFAGAVLNVSDWLRAADVFAFPTENEAFGLSLVEAMACALPAVTTAVGGLGDFVQDQVNALVIAPGDVEGLARSLRRLLSDPALAARVGAAAREQVLARFGQESVAAAYEALLASLLQEHTAGARA